MTWDDDRNWDNATPDFAHRGIIPSPFDVTISVTTANTDSITIDAGASLTIKWNGKLTLKNTGPPAIGDSLIEGELKIEKGGELFIENDLGIEGNGGTITGLTAGVGATPKITTQNASTVLTIRSSTGGSTQATSLVLQGLLEIKAALDNDAFVVANTDTLSLSNFAKIGDDGFWVAENAEYLLVNAAVTGTSEWRLIDDQRAVIKFNQANTTLGGLFRIERGTLDVDQNITTTGGLDFKSVGAFHPQIDVASGKIAEFFGP